MSDTPRTDAVFYHPDSVVCGIVEISRQIERELAAVTAERDALIKSAAQHDTVCMDSTHDHANRVEEAVCSLRFQRDANKLDNPCEKHIDVVANGYCPICLIEQLAAVTAEREYYKHELNAANATLSRIAKDADDIRNGAYCDHAKIAQDALVVKKVDYDDDLAKAEAALAACRAAAGEQDIRLAGVEAERDHYRAALAKCDQYREGFVPVAHDALRGALVLANCLAERMLAGGEITSIEQFIDNNDNVAKIENALAQNTLGVK